MIHDRIALQTLCLGQPLKKGLHTAGQLACNGVQIDLRSELCPSDLSDTAVRQLRKMLDDLNLRIGSVTFPTRRGYANPVDLERRVDATLAAMQAASKLGARTMVLSLGVVPNVAAEEFVPLVEVLTLLGNQGNRLGVALAAEVSEADFTTLSALLEVLDEGLLGIDVNPATLIACDGSPSELIEQLGQYARHVYANDAVRGFGGAGTQTVELGRGTADFPTLLGMLEEHSYQGWVTIQRRGSQQTIVDCENAVAFLRSL